MKSQQLFRVMSSWSNAKDFTSKEAASSYGHRLSDQGRVAKVSQYVNRKWRLLYEIDADPKALADPGDFPELEAR